MLAETDDTEAKCWCNLFQIISIIIQTNLQLSNFKVEVFVLKMLNHFWTQ